MLPDISAVLSARQQPGLKSEMLCLAESAWQTLFAGVHREKLQPWVAFSMRGQSPLCAAGTDAAPNVLRALPDWPGRAAGRGSCLLQHKWPHSSTQVGLRGTPRRRPPRGLVVQMFIGNGSPMMGDMLDSDACM